MTPGVCSFCSCSHASHVLCGFYSSSHVLLAVGALAAVGSCENSRHLLPHVLNMFFASHLRLRCVSPTVVTCHHVSLCVIRYLNILNWLGGTPTSYETTYVRNVTFCNLDKGPIFVAPELISNPPLFLETVGSPPPCTAVGYQSEDREAGRPVLSLIPRWLVNTCKSLV